MVDNNDGESGSNAIDVKLGALLGESILEISCFFLLHRGHYGFSHSASSFRMGSLSSRKTYEHIMYRDWVFVPETLRKGEIEGQRSSSTDININIWHLPGVSRALQLNLDGRYQEGYHTGCVSEKQRRIYESYDWEAGCFRDRKMKLRPRPVFSVSRNKRPIVALAVVAVVVDLDG
jgi:hypothetical protein